MSGKGAQQNGELFAVVPAAGSGSRMHLPTPKQFIDIDGQSVLVRTVNRLFGIPQLQKVVISAESSSLGKIGALPFKCKDKIEFCEGGATRAESVLNGLVHLQPTASSGAFVMVHDAARPCVRTDDIMCLVKEAMDDHGGILAMRVSDTIKCADQDQRAVDTLTREALWRAATPQLFNCHLLLNALQAALQDGVTITDEASAMQHAGYKPKLVECHTDNIKITTAPDLVLAEYYLSAQSKDQNQVSER